MELINITDDNFEQEVLNSEVPVIAEFSADWCSPCKALHSLLEYYAGQYAGRLKFAKINVDQGNGAVETYKIANVPTVIIFKDKQVVDKFVGAKQKNDLDEIFNRLIN